MIFGRIVMGIVEKFSTGASVRRSEDERFVTGKGQYTDDVNIEEPQGSRWRSRLDKRGLFPCFERWSGLGSLVI